MKKVLNVGHCDYDHGNIRSLLTDHFDAEIQLARSRREAIESAQLGDWDLILVNRIFEEDGDSGLELIKVLKADPVTRSVPVMLVSNFADAQRAAIESGALPGFGKATLKTSATLEELRKVLG